MIRTTTTPVLSLVLAALLGVAALPAAAPRAVVSVRSSIELVRPSEAVHAAKPQVIPLWPEGVPGLLANAAEERIVDGRIVGIHYPSLTLYTPAAGRANGTAVIYCPGGGYVRLSIGDEGGADTKWLNGLGVTVFVLKYRLVEYGHPAPLRDVLRAIRIVRSRTAEFGVRPDRIGLLGGSAGGHLAASASTMWDAPVGKTGAVIDSVDARPDFAMLIYPVVTMEDPFVHKGSRSALLGKTPSPDLIQLLSIEKHVRKDTPPMFLVATMADQSVPVENSLSLYKALRDGGVQAEMHIYARGAHGASRDPQYGQTSFWPQRAEEWLRANGWLQQ
jgi:acetyl esterase/lipase